MRVIGVLVIVMKVVEGVTIQTKITTKMGIIEEVKKKQEAKRVLKIVEVTRKLLVAKK